MMNIYFKTFKKNISLLLCMLFLSYCSYSQIGISNSFPNNNPTYLIQNILIGSGVSVSNVSFSGNTIQIGYFSSGASIGMNSGIVMSSGRALDADLNGNPSRGSSGNGTPANGIQCVTNLNTLCNDLYTVANSVSSLLGQSFSVWSINDMCVLEFDFVPESNTVRFDYSFGSEEYLYYVNTQFNDVFGFFISGPGITGSYSSPPGFPNGSENIAIIPGSNPL